VAKPHPIVTDFPYLKASMGRKDKDCPALVRKSLDLNRCGTMMFLVNAL
jgi:hypothetical protein